MAPKVTLGQVLSKIGPWTVPYSLELRQHTENWTCFVELTVTVLHLMQHGVIIIIIIITIIIIIIIIIINGIKLYTQTYREVTANRQYVIIKNNKDKTSTLIDVAILADRNVVQKEAENKLKYKSLCIQIQRM
jgi:hypothetical protein